MECRDVHKNRHEPDSPLCETSSQMTCEVTKEPAIFLRGENYLAWDLYIQMLSVMDIGTDGYFTGFLVAMKWVFEHEDLTMKSPKHLKDLISRITYIRTVHNNAIAEMRKAEAESNKHK